MFRKLFNFGFTLIMLFTTGYLKKKRKNMYVTLKNYETVFMFPLKHFFSTQLIADFWKQRKCISHIVNVYTCQIYQL